MNIQGRGIIITGATSGIGYHLAKRIYEKGGILLLVGRNEDKLGRLKEEFGGCVVIKADLTDKEGRDRVISAAFESLESVDILINNAGVGFYGSILDADEETLRKVMELNFWAPLDLTRKFIKMSNHRKVIVVNVISLIAFIPISKWNIYATSKFAERSIFMSMREEVRRSNAKIINIYPPAVKTSFFENTLGEKPKPVGHAVSPEKVANVIVKAIEREKEEVFVSFFDFLSSKLLSLFMPTAVRIFGYK